MAYPHELVRAVARGESVDGSKLVRSAVASAIEHRMAALMLRAVQDHGELPSEPAASLVAFDMAVTDRRRALDCVLGVVHERLEAAGVTHTFVKGPISARRWFQSATDRPYSDIDVVVPRGDQLATALATLDPVHPAITVLTDRRAANLLSSVEAVVDGVRVDLQTDALRSGLGPKAYEEWSAGTETLDGMRVFDAEHEMVVFLLHQGRDRFRYVLGVDEARRRLRGPIDWPRLEALARAEGIWDQVAVALEVMCHELGIENPVEPPQGWRTVLWRRLWRPKVRLLGEEGRVRHVVRARWLMPLTTKGRTLDAVRWMIRSWFPPDRVLGLKYPRATGPYLWRVVAVRVRVFTRRRFSAWRNPNS